MEEARLSGEAIEVLKRGKRLANVIPAPAQSDYRPGKFKDSVRIVGDILVDGQDLGVDWEAMN